jgi:hypothetical protein
MKKNLIKFNIGDRVRCITRPSRNILGERHEYGVVVPYRGEHNPKSPRIRWNTGWGFNVPADEIVRITPEEETLFPEIQLADSDRAVASSRITKPIRNTGTTNHYIISDKEGIWLTTTPAPSDEILFTTTDKTEAEYALCRYL